MGNITVGMQVTVISMEFLVTDLVEMDEFCHLLNKPCLLAKIQLCVRPNS